MKMYDDRQRVVYYQVGIGNGNAKILSDHDLWRLPQRDDAMKGHARRYIAHRPVFAAGPPGTKVAPSLAGRLAAAFGLCAQLWPHSALGSKCLRDGVHVFGLARTEPCRSAGDRVTGGLLPRVPVARRPGVGCH